MKEKDITECFGCKFTKINPDYNDYNIFRVTNKTFRRNQKIGNNM